MKSRWDAMAPRERGLISLAGVLVAATLLWVGVWEPLDRHREDLRGRVQAQQALADWLTALDPEQLQHSGAAARSLDGRSPLAVIDQTARAAGLAGALARIEPGAPGEIRVTLQRAEFPALMDWLDPLVASRPFQVAELRADRVEQGRVDATIRLQRID